MIINSENMNTAQDVYKTDKIDIIGYAKELMEKYGLSAHEISVILGLQDSQFSDFLNGSHEAGLDINSISCLTMLYFLDKISLDERLKAFTDELFAKSNVTLTILAKLTQISEERIRHFFEINEGLTIDEKYKLAVLLTCLNLFFINR